MASPLAPSDPHARPRAPRRGRAAPRIVALTLLALSSVSGLASPRGTGAAAPLPPPARPDAAPGPAEAAWRRVQEAIGPTAPGTLDAQCAAYARQRIGQARTRSTRFHEERRAARGDAEILRALRRTEDAWDARERRAAAYFLAHWRRIREAPPA